MARVPPLPPPLPLTSVDKGSVFGGYLKTKTDEHCGYTCNHCDLNIVSETLRINQVKPIAQSGPSCGIAALAMLLSVTPSELTVEDIFTEAKCRGFTNNGEMFSVRNMKALTDAVVSPWLKTEMFTNGLTANESYIVDRLYLGDFMLIPYDADKDHSPCCREGHKAHWALVTGVLTDFEGEVSVTARHGKSRHVAVWRLDQLQRSNDNLVQLDPERAVDGRDYVLPEGGVRAGLASQFILISRSSFSVHPHQPA